MEYLKVTKLSRKIVVGCCPSGTIEREKYISLNWL